MATSALRRLAASTAGALLVAAAGCAPPYVGQGAVPLHRTVHTTAGSYGEALREWTRAALVIDKLDPEIEVYATFLAADFRHAYVAQLAERMAMSDAAREAKLKAELAEAAEKHVFIVAFNAGDMSWNDIGRLRTSWRVTLFDDAGGETESLSIDRFPEPKLNDVEMFPYIDDFHYVYIVKFPAQKPEGTPVLPPGVKVLGLRIGSALARAELTWRTQGN